MKRPFFSIVVPCLNEEKFLPNLLESLARQSTKDFEVIVVDGGSKDGTLTVAASWQTRLPGLNLQVSKKRGQSVQRNMGAQIAAGKYLVFVDADSVLLPYALRRMKDFIEETGSRFFTGWTRPDSEKPGDVTLALLANMFIEGSLLVKHSTAVGAFMVVEKGLFSGAGGFDEHMTFGEDYDLTRRIGEAGIALDVLRETVYVYSLRRLRREGKLKFFRLYAKGTIVGLLTNRALGKVPGYIMGGHMYRKETKRQPGLAQALGKYERALKKLLRELF